jgi:hypothetical protein
VAALVVVTAAACGDAPLRRAPMTVAAPATTAATAPEPSPPATVSPAPEPAPRRRLVRWRGPVEHLFFHPLVQDPRRTFHGSEGQGFRDYFVTVREFRRILAALERHRYVLVDIERAVSGRLRVPRGRKPLVISVDDLNYYDYMRRTGPAFRLALAPDGGVAVELRDRRGRHPRLSHAREIVPILDRFVVAHPDFSLNGAKGVIALTGYEGVLGERTNEFGARDIAARRRRARAVVARMRATGWRFASHSWGHIDLSRSSTARIAADAARWRRDVEPITGPTDIYVYPFGAPPSDAARTMLHATFGFRVFCPIDVRAFTTRIGAVVVMARRHVDGLAFTGQRANLLPMFDVRRVIDRAARR